MASNPVDSVIVRFELDSTGLASKIASINRQIQSGLKRVKLDVNFNTTNINSQIKALHTHIQSVLSKTQPKLQFGINRNNLASLRRQISQYFAQRPVPVSIRPSAVAAVPGVTLAAARATSATAQSARNMAQGFHLARSNAELLASSIFTIRNVMAALSTLGVFKVFKEIREASADFETALVQVAKTANLTNDEMQELGNIIELMGTKLPITSKELLNIAIAAGQVGISGTQNIARFTQALGQLALATDVQGEEGARQVARILTLTKTNVSDVDRFTASLVDLGNAAPVTEKEILEVATRLAQSSAIYELSSEEILAIATAMRELGVQAELGGTQFGLVLQALTKASMSPGTKAAEVISGIGLELEKFRDVMRTDPAEGFVQFVEALGKLDESQISAALAQMGFEGSRMMTVIGPLAENFSKLRLRVNQSKSAWKDNTAALKEVQRQAQTFNGQMTMIGNSLQRIVKTLGDDLNPMLARTALWFNEIATADIDRTARSIKTLGIALAAMAAIKGPIFASDILIGLRRLKLLRDQQRAIVLTTLASEVSINASLIRMGLKFSSVSNVAVLAIGAIAASLYAAASKISRDVQRISGTSESLGAWQTIFVITTETIKNLKEEFPGVATGLTEIADAAVKVTGKKPDQSWFNWFADIGNAIKEVKSTFVTQPAAKFLVLDSLETKLKSTQERIDVLKTRLINIVAYLKKVEMGEIAVDPEQIAKAKKQFQEYAKELSVLTTNAESLAGSIKDIKGETVSMTSAFSKAITAAVKAQEAVKVFDPKVAKQSVDAIEEVGAEFTNFNDDVEKARQTLEDLNYELENNSFAQGKFTNEFSKFLGAQGLKSFVQLAKDQENALEGWKNKAKELADQKALLTEQVRLGKEAELDVSAEEAAIANADKLLQAYQQLLSSGTDIIKLQDDLKAAFVKSQIEDFLEEERQSIHVFNRQIEELSKSVSTMDPEILARLENKFGHLIPLAQQLGIDLQGMFEEAAKRGEALPRTLERFRGFKDLSNAVAASNIQLRIMQEIGGSLGQDFAQFAASFMDTAEEINALNFDDVLALWIQFKNLRFDASVVKVTEAVRDFNKQIASVSLSSKDMARALEMSDAQYAALEDSVGGIDEKFAQWLLTSGLLGDELLRLGHVLGIIKKRIEELEDTERIKQLGEAIGDAFASFGDDITRSLLEGEASLDSFKETFRQFANEIIRQILRILVWQRIGDAISGAIGRIGAPPTPAAKGQVFAYAKGGTLPRNRVVNRPTMAPMALFGEAGPEAIMPLVRSGKGLGVRDARSRFALPLARDRSGSLSVDTGPLIKAILAQKSLGKNDAISLFRMLSGIAPSIMKPGPRRGSNFFRDPIYARGGSGLFGLAREKFINEMGEVKYRPQLKRFIRKLTSIGSEYDQQKFLARVREAYESGDQDTINDMLAMKQGAAFTAPAMQTMQAPITSFASGAAFAHPSMTAYAQGGVPDLSAGTTYHYESQSPVSISFHVDARGASNPAEVERAAERVFVKHYPQLLEAAKNKIDSTRKRNPNWLRS